MGSGRWSDSDWKSYTTTNSYHTKTVDEIFTKRSIADDLNPFGKIRESRDSSDNPTSTAIIVGLDVTGSMGVVLDAMARKGLNTLVNEVYNRKPVTDPHVMCLGVGDVESDSAPIQATQFEADIRIAEQLEKIYLERGGGGNSYESYGLAWYFAGARTSIDCFEKRNKKGYLFTVGDECPTPRISASKVEKFLGVKIESDLLMEQMLAIASRQYEVFHIIVEEGSYFSSRPDETFTKWTNLLGQRAIRLSDHTKLAEVIVSTIQVAEGVDPIIVANSWDGTTNLIVRNAINSITNQNQNSDIVAL